MDDDYFADDFSLVYIALHSTTYNLILLLSTSALKSSLLSIDNMSIFSAFGNILGRPLSWFTGGGEPTSSASSIEAHDSDSVGSDGSDYEDVEPYEPSIIDVLIVKAMLNKALALPPELLNTIFDLAEYWPHSTTEWSGGPLSIYGGRRDREDVFLVRSHHTPSYV